MSKLLKVAIPLVLLAVAFVTVPIAVANENVCHAIKAAENAACVRAQVDPLRASTLYREVRSVHDIGDNCKCVEYIFEPKCLDARIPCRIASQVVTATVDCATEIATCP
jgi:hypothetical protein